MPVKTPNSNLFLRKAKKLIYKHRSISLLPLIQKVFERVIHYQTNAFLKGQNLLYNYQSGYRSNHSTNWCLNNHSPTKLLTDKILKGFDEGLISGMILIDLNIINHEILFKNLKAMGSSEGCITWFQLYLFQRIFLFIIIENQLSDYRRISCGIAQGSILVHLLFLIYLNDMPQAVNSNLFLYADSSCLVF